MSRFTLLRTLLCLFAATFTAGCTVQSPSANQGSPIQTALLAGKVHGGQQPVSGATIQLYAVGTSGDGSASTPLLTKTIVTDAGGGFNITADYSCANASQVYITATGGNPGLSSGNPNLAMMTALGPCSALTSDTFISINELTTVAGVSALAPFMTSASSVGSGVADSPALASAFALAAELVNTSSGATPGDGVPSGATVPTSLINTLGDIVAPCVNSAGGAAGDATPCGQFFSLTSIGSNASPTDTIAALLSVANHPALNTVALFELSSPSSPFQPTLSQPPSDFSVRLNLPMPVVSQIAPASLTAGGGAATLDIKGSGFVTSSVVFWNQVALPTQYVSAGELMVSVNAGLTASSGTPQIVVVTPGGGQSSATTFQVSAPAPVLTSISPQVVLISQPATVVLTGSGFIANSVVQWKGVPKPTTFLTPNTLQVSLSAADTANPGAGQLTVSNPAPGGGTSGPASLTVSFVPAPTITGVTFSSYPTAAGCRQLQASVTGTNFVPGSTNLVVNGTTLSAGVSSSTNLIANLPVGFSGNALNTSFVASISFGFAVNSAPYSPPASSTPVLALCALPTAPTIYPSSQFQLAFTSSLWNLPGTPTINSITPPSGITTLTPLPLAVSTAATPVVFNAGTTLTAGNLLIPFSGSLGSASSSGTAQVTVASTAPPNFSLNNANIRELGVPIGGSASATFYSLANSIAAVDYTVELTASGLPAGTTATITPSRIIPGQSFTLAIAATTNAPTTQNATVTITGTADAAVPASSISLSVDVTVPPGGLANNRTDFVSTAATPAAMVYSRASDLIYSANPTWNRIDIISNASRTVINSIPLRGPRALDITQDGSTVWIGTDGQQVYALNTRTNALTRYLVPGLYANNLVRWDDSAIFALADGTLLLTVEPGAGSGSFYNFVWNPATNAITNLSSTTYLTVRSGNAMKVYGTTANSSTCQIAVYDVASKAIINPPTVSEPCNFYAVNQDGSAIVASNNGHFGLYDGSFKFIGLLPTDLTFPGIPATGGFVFSPDGATLYQIGQGTNSGALIFTMDVATRTVLGTAPAMGGLTQVKAVDNSGVLLGVQTFGIGFEDSSFFQNYGTNIYTQTYPVLLTPNAGPLAGGTVSVPYGYFSLTPDVWYGANRGAATNTAGSVNIVSPSGNSPGPVNVKYIFPSGAEVFTPQAFTYSAYPQYATLAGSTPSGGVAGQISGYGLPADSSGGSVTVGGSAAAITTVAGQYPAYTPEPFKSTYLSFTIPAGSPGSADLQLTTPNGTGTLPKAIFYAKSVTDYASSDTFTDVLYDGPRNQVYLSAGDHIDVFSLASNQFLTPLRPARNGATSSFRGLALTPDGTKLLAANLLDGSLGVINPDSPSQTFAIAITAATGAGTTCATGPFSVAALLNQQVLVSSGLPPGIGGCPYNGGLYLANLQTHSVAAQNTSCSGTSETTTDGTLAIIGNQGGVDCFYSATTGTFHLTPLGAYSYVGVSLAGDGNIAAVGNTFSDPAGNGIGIIGRPAAFYNISGTYPANNYPAGVLNHPRLNASGSLYFWAYPNYFEIIDGPTGTLRLRFSLAETVQNVETPLAIDDGGQRVFLITSAGLTIVDLGAARLSIGHVTPSTAAAGAVIQVRGSGFQPGSTATVDAQAANVTYVDANTLSVTLPSLASGPHDLTLTNPDGTSYTLHSGISYP